MASLSALPTLSWSGNVGSPSDQSLRRSQLLRPRYFLARPGDSVDVALVAAGSDDINWVDAESVLTESPQARLKIRAARSNRQKGQ